MRRKYLIIFLIIFLIECLIGTFLNHGFIRENIGDILVVPCIYVMFRIIFLNVKHLSFYVLLFAFLIEFLQLFNVTTLISGNNEALSIALGGTFDIKDILCYVIGYVLIFLFEKHRTHIG